MTDQATAISDGRSELEGLRERVRSDLIAAREAFLRMDGEKSIYLAHRLACNRSPTGLDTLVALRDALPAPFTDFHQFESSRGWRAKDSYAVFDRAIALTQEQT